MQRDNWVRLKCKYKWVNSHKKDSRVYPLCGSCIIYCLKTIKSQKKEIGVIAPLT